MRLIRPVIAALYLLNFPGYARLSAANSFSLSDKGLLLHMLPIFLSLFLFPLIFPLLFLKITEIFYLYIRMHMFKISYGNIVSEHDQIMLIII